MPVIFTEQPSMQRPLLLLLLGMPIVLGASSLPSDGPVPQPKPAGEESNTASDKPSSPAPDTRAGSHEDSREDGASASAPEDAQPDPATRSEEHTSELQSLMRIS